VPVEEEEEEEGEEEEEEEEEKEEKEEEELRIHKKSICSLKLASSYLRYCEA
jgi:hypothetical protein